MPPMPLKIETHEASQPGFKIVTLTGGLTLETVAQFNTALREDAVESMVLDMSGLEWLDSAGVGALVQLLVRREKSSAKLALCGLTPRNNAVLQVAQVLKLFSVFPTAADAISHYASRT
jgi:anti-sigma B factor antagonist